MVLEDFGDALFPALLDAQSLPAMYDAAVDALAVMHARPPPAAQPRGGAAEMAAAAAATFLDWWWPAAFGAPPPAAARTDFASAMAELLRPVEGSAGLVHRDYFAGNLFWRPEQEGVARVGIIDFQDAALGPPSYDLVSLVEDARRVLPDGLAERQITRYLALRPELDAVSFRAGFAACAAQRHLRVAALWVRLDRRDRRPQYRRFAPITWALLDRALARPQAAPLAAFLDRWVPPALRRDPPDAAEREA